MNRTMKKNISVLSVILLFVLSGCTDLDLNPLDQISTPTFWKSRSDFDMALAANYSTMLTRQWSYELPVWDCLTDNGYAQHNSGGAKDIVAGTISSSSGGLISVIYTDSYKAIARNNLFLQQLTTYAGTDMSEADKKTYEAEVRFLRAFYYFQLYHLYGDVPLVLEPLTLETQQQPKVPAARILEQIMTDLDFAIENLNDKPYYENSGHACRTSAQALKVRILIFTAYGNDGTANIQTLTEVRDLSLDIMQEYSLSPVFEDLFRTAGQKNNREIIFSANFLAPSSYGEWDMYYGDWVVASPLQNFVNSFECTDGLPYGESPLTNTVNPFQNRDPRLAKTVFVDHPDFGAGKVHLPSNSRPTGYGLMKFLEPSNIPFGFSTMSEQNAVVLRLADILLMYAEAQNEIAGPDASVYQAMTDLRARVDMPPYPAGLTKEQMRGRIRHERRVELAFEGLRYFDLKRWRIADDILNGVTDGLLPYHFEDKFYLWPIPQPEIDKSGGVLEQNPDYL